MRTWTYIDRTGVRYLVFHRNASNRCWEHAYDLRGVCPACLGTSTAAPDDKKLSTAPTKG